MAWFPNWATSSNNNIQKIHATLGEHYLHIAYMEIRSKTAFFYFIKKAHDHYTRSSNDYLNVHKQLSELVNQIVSNPEGVWSEINREPLKDCNIATRDYTIDATEAWSKAFNFAHEKIMNQGIPSSLHFMETSSARTSSTERSSQSSGEAHEEKKSSSQFDNLGLHKRCKGSRDSNATTNPLLQLT